MMADEENQDPKEGSSLPEVVSQATVKALQEFDSGEMEEGEKPEGEQQPAEEAGSQGSSRPASQKSTPRELKQDSRQGSASRQGGSRPTSAVGSQPRSGAGSRQAPSRQASRPTSAVAPQEGSRPPSGAKSPAGSQAGSMRYSRADTAPQMDEEAQDDYGTQSPAGGEEEEMPEESGSLMPYGSTGQESAPQRTSQYNYSGQPPSDPGDGDGGDDSDGGHDGDGGEDDSDGSDQEAEMVVLDPDHPLMVRFQNALKTHLTKLNERAALELRELENSLKKKKKEREDLGVELYGQQQELARFQMLLERAHDEYAKLHQDRQKMEQELEDVRHLYQTTQTKVNKDKKKSAELQAEVENLALRLFYMENAKQDVRSDIAIMRRAAEKAETEVTKIEVEKQKQDLFVDRLVERVDKLKEEIAMYEAQIAAQQDETKAAKDALMEANMEIDAITLEKKQLFQHWNSSLIGMRRRDEAHASMQEALHEQEQKILSLETEIEGYKKSINKEQELNEKLTLILSKTERDIETVTKQLMQCQQKHDALKAEYTTYTRMLHETEQSLNRAMADKTVRQNELTALRKQIEKEFLEKVKLEDEIMERLRSQLTMEKAAQYTKKLTAKMREKTKHLETQMAEVENQIATDALEMSNVKARVERLKKIMEELDAEIKEKNEIVTKSENEIIKRNGIIERKQTIIDQYNKKLEQLISAAGGVELGPLEITINSLTKSIELKQQEIADLQQMWLRQQGELVRLSKEKDEQSQDVEKHKKQLTILAQKKIKTEHEIEQQNREIYDIERNVRNMRNDIVRLNTLLHRESGSKQELEANNILLEGDFINSLKEAEMESIELQAKLDGVKEEKERLLNSLVEAERQIMLWEKKTQLARETRSAVDSEVGQGEIKAMKAEIHRMQVRHSQLMKTQEKMIQDMEKAVSRRDTIVTRGVAVQQNLTGTNKSSKNNKVVTKGIFEKQMAELRKKIKNTIQEANSCDGEIRDLREQQADLSKQLEERQINCQQLQSSSDTLDGDIERLLEIKHKNMSEILTKQQRMKYYQQVKEGKYTKLCKSDSALELEEKKQKERLQALSTIVDSLNQEFPHVQPALRRVTLALTARTMPQDDD